MINPITLEAKLLLQAAWAKKLDWDDSPPIHIQQAWEKIMERWSVQKGLKIPRFVGTENKDNIFELHTFVDASKVAYGACVYLRIQDGSYVRCNLVLSKSLLKPISAKNLTIPRLELQAALIAHKVGRAVKKHLNLEIKRSILWSDSQCVIHWIRSQEHAENFVRKRVNLIKENEVHYVPTKDNPADLVTRVTSPEELKQSDTWWKGPSWLRKKEK